ncbi:sensor [Methylosinus sp. C49]|uniref:FecR family protein n=1 Tax=Methylosinus sp. C49 TaxID=2699395 RepID=UPI00136790B4|nr:FecR family protein [Methylosinus sp. C49]BBU60476.1 sensor [Methylosinus sp. C49]
MATITPYKRQIGAEMEEDDAPRDRANRRRAAIEWWTRLDSRAPTPQEREAFVIWLTDDPANREAFEKVCRIWGDLEDLRPLIDAFEVPPPRRTRRVRVAAVLSGLAITLLSYVFFDDAWIMLRAQTRTGVAETRTIRLVDGSRIELGPRSAISLDFDEGKRNVTLLKGEAWFDVAPDAGRPFSVLVARGSVTALGTSFDISTTGERTEITVAQHRVRVMTGGPAIIVDEGEQSAFGPGVAAVDPYRVQVDHVAAWRRGKLIFDDKPLAEVVSVLGHYLSGYILILDPSIRERRVSGVFDAADPIAAISAIEKALGLRALDLGYLVVLTG